MQTPPAPAPLPSHWVDNAAPTSLADVPAPRAAWLRDAMAIAEALFETEAGPPSELELRWLARELDDYLTKIGGQTRLIVRASLVVLAAAIPAVARRPVPLRRLSLAARVHALEVLERAPLVSLNVLAVKGPLCILWYEHPDHARQIGLGRDPARPPR